MTEDNCKKVYAGWRDQGLIPSEASRLKRYNKEFDEIFSSDLRRCVETAKLLFPNRTHREMRELREIHFGEWEGFTYEELKSNASYQQWISDFENRKPPNGESLAAFRFRIFRGWNKVMSVNKGNRIAIITHSGVIREFLTAYAPEIRNPWDWTVPHGGGFELIFEVKELRRGARCTLLQEVPSPENGDG
ncbi:histidine phosphatase family protein [Pseudalkalibacillus sp. SCS-8]|uniref:histidine phosphatase family protein n=1 Tax=Pseudalkalibacillus nanhaiensis TaxID=3115291 RepID=UPI0032DA115C